MGSSASENRAGWERPVPSRSALVIRLRAGARVRVFVECISLARAVVASTPPDIPVIIFSGVPSESAELERSRARTRLIEKPYSLVLLVETLEEMLAESSSQNLHS